MYHHLEQGAPCGYPYSLPAALFARHLDDIQRWGYHTITFHELFQALAGGPPLPSKPVIITFDDAYASVSQLAIPLLLARGQRCTIFAISDFIGGINQWDIDQGMPRLELMDAPMFQQAISNGMELGSHTCRHLNLTQQTPAVQAEEIHRSKTALEAQFGQPIEVFCYPYGSHTAAMQPSLESAGYKGAVSIFTNSPTVTAAPYQMRRVYPHLADSTWRFRLKLSQTYLRYIAWRDRNSPE
jgi:peptidoglycan/xylan/chitin deacetylase (PgdA/CDA1 family)